MIAHDIDSLHGPRLWPWLAAALVNWAYIATILVLVAALPRWWMFALAWLLIGGFQHRLALLGHEGCHFLVSDRDAVNDTLTSLLCLNPLMMSLQGYRDFHFRHHAHVGTPEDPERRHTHHVTLGQWTRPLNLSVVAWQLATDLVGGAVPHILMAMKLTRPARPSDMAGPIAQAIVVSGLLIYFGAWWVVAIWFLSLWTSFFMFFRLRLWTEHVVDEGADPTLRVQLPNLLSVFVYPFGAFHWEHHMYPQVSVFELPRVRAATKNLGIPVMRPDEFANYLMREPEW